MYRRRALGRFDHLARTFGISISCATPECNETHYRSRPSFAQRSLLLSNRRTLNLDHPTENIWCPRIFRKDGSSRTFFVTSADRETQVSSAINKEEAKTARLTSCCITRSTPWKTIRPNLTIRRLLAKRPFLLGPYMVTRVSLIFLLTA